MSHMTKAPSLKKTAAGSSPQAKRFSTEFQQEAVRILEAGRSATQLSRELGVSTWSLGRWRKRHGMGGAGAGPLGRSPKGARAGDTDAVALADEVSQLRAELHAITRQRDILKKALAILGQESLHAIC